MEPSLQETLFGLPSVADLAPEQRWLIWGMRRWVRARRDGQCPVPILAKALSSRAAAMAIHKTVLTVGQLWDGEFSVSSPKSAELTYCEMHIAQLLAAVMTQDESAFEEMLCDMFDQKARIDIWVVLADAGRAQIQSRQPMISPDGPATLH